MKKHVVALASLLLTAVALPASAGERTALGTIPVLPAPKDATTPPPLMGVPGLRVVVQKRVMRDYTTLTASIAQGYCIVQREVSFSLTDESSTTEAEEIWHFTEKDDKATLERIRFEVAIDQAWVKSKTSIELRAIANEAGVKVWAMKEADGTLVFLAKGGQSGKESMQGSKKEDLPTFDFTSSSCSFGASRIGPIASAKGAAAQLTGDLPPEGEGKAKTVPRFVVDASTTKLSRDPETVVSVRVRRIEP